MLLGYNPNIPHNVATLAETDGGWSSTPYPHFRNLHVLVPTSDDLVMCWCTMANLWEPRCLSGNVCRRNSASSFWKDVHIPDVGITPCSWHYSKSTERGITAQFHTPSLLLLLWYVRRLFNTSEPQLSPRTAEDCLTKFCWECMTFVPPLKKKSFSPIE